MAVHLQSLFLFALFILFYFYIVLFKLLYLVVVSRFYSNSLLVVLPNCLLKKFHVMTRVLVARHICSLSPGVQFVRQMQRAQWCQTHFV